MIRFPFSLWAISWFIFLTSSLLERWEVWTVHPFTIFYGFLVVSLPIISISLIFDLFTRFDSLLLTWPLQPFIRLQDFFAVIHSTPSRPLRHEWALYTTINLTNQVRNWCMRKILRRCYWLRPVGVASRPVDVHTISERSET